MRGLVRAGDLLHQRVRRVLRVALGPVPVQPEGGRVRGQPRIGRGRLLHREPHLLERLLRAPGGRVPDADPDAGHLRHAGGPRSGVEPADVHAVGRLDVGERRVAVAGRRARRSSAARAAEVPRAPPAEARIGLTELPAASACPARPSTVISIQTIAMPASSSSSSVGSSSTAASASTPARPAASAPLPVHSSSMTASTVRSPRCQPGCDASSARIASSAHREPALHVARRRGRRASRPGSSARTAATSSRPRPRPARRRCARSRSRLGADSPAPARRATRS